MNWPWRDRKIARGGGSSTRYVLRACSEGKTKTVALRSEQLEKMVQLAADLPEQMEFALLPFLRENEDVFAWTPSDLQGVDQNLIEHHLNIDPKKKPRKQKAQKMSMEWKEAARVKVHKLLDANVILEVIHIEWLANPVLVKNNNDKW